MIWLVGKKLPAMSQSDTAAGVTGTESWLVPGGKLTIAE